MTDAIKAGVDSLLVAKAVGWRSIDMVNTYSKNIGTAITSQAINAGMAGEKAGQAYKAARRRRN